MATGDGVRGWLASLPTTPRRVVVVGTFLAVYGLVYVLVVLAGAWLFDDPAEWTRPLGPMIGAALGSGLGAWIRRRRMGSSDNVRQFTRAVRRRRLPDGADPAVWAPLLAGERRAQQRLRRIVLPVTGLVVAAAALAATVTGLGWVGATVTLAVGAGLVVVLWLAGRRSLVRIDALTDQLQATSPTD